MQVSASRGGECAAESSNGKNDEAIATGVNNANALWEDTATFCWSETDFARGWETGAVFLGDVAQQVLFAQQAGWHALFIAVSETMQLRAETWNGVAIRATAIAREIVIRP